MLHAQRIFVMKKIILSIFTILLCAGAVGSTFFLLDRSAPGIEVKGTPSLGCKVTFNDLLNYASARDDKGVKSFFIEENSLSDIADYDYLTYVAIDESNNVTKQRVSVHVDPEVKTYHIEVKEPIHAQIRESLNAGEYLKLKNECGWEIDDTFVIENVDFTIKEEYIGKISVRKHSDVDPVFATVEVDNFNAPRIILTDETYKDWANMIYTDEYFLGFIDHIEDDKDDPNDLLAKVTTNWREQMIPFKSGLMTRGGTFTITYKVTDSDGNTGQESFKLLLEVPVYAPAEPAEEPVEGE